MEISIIKSEEDYERTLKIIDKLLEAPENSTDSERLQILSIIFEDYENKYYKIDIPDPVEAINFRME